MCKQQIKLARNCKTKRSWLETILSPWSEILQNSSCVFTAVYEILTALEPALPEEKIQKQVRSTQYQFRVFKNADCFMSLRRRHLDKAVTLLFWLRNSTMQRKKRNVGCCLLPNTRIWDLQWQRLIFYRLSCWVPAVQRSLSWQPNRPSRCAPAYVKNQAIDAVQA